VKREPPYNPLDKRNLGVSVADALLERPMYPQPPEEPFSGAGIYALYYQGSLRLYERLSKLSQTSPIYVGKAYAMCSK